MSRRYLSEARDGDINVLNRLFGRDLAADGWVVKDRSGRTVRAEKPISEERRQVAVPDPSMIWALRGRKR